MLTWFQAQQACAAAGKHLCTNNEWQAAVAGTYEPGAWPGERGPCDGTLPAPGRCNTCSAGLRRTGQAGRVAGGTNDCISMRGAEDMIGNLREWVGVDPDQTPIIMRPGALRGGDCKSQTRAGRLAWASNLSPSSSDGRYGFRCCRER